MMSMLGSRRQGDLQPIHATQVQVLRAALRDVELPPDKSSRPCSCLRSWLSSAHGAVQSGTPTEDLRPSKFAVILDAPPLFSRTAFGRG